MTYAPARLLELRHYLQPLTGLADYELGIVGDTAHVGGYHHGWDQRRIVDGVTSDYSWTESTRDSSNKSNAASAFDLGMFARLREFSVWLAGQCAAGTADTQDIREVIYSPDGVTVKRWDRLGKRSSGDSSHLTHTHISFFRDAEDRDKTAVFRRFFEGDGMANEERDAVEAWRVDAAYFDLPETRGGPRPGEKNMARAARVALEAKVDGVAAKVDGLVKPEPAQVDLDALVAKLAPVIKAQAAAAVSEVLGKLDGATPAS